MTPATRSRLRAELLGVLADAAPDLPLRSSVSAVDRLLDTLVPNGTDPAPHVTRARWTAEEDAELNRLVAEGHPPAGIAAALGRTERAITSRISWAAKRATASG